MTPDKRDLAILYKQTFNTEAGKKVLADLRDFSGMDVRTDPRHSGIDTNVLLFYEAQRSLVLYILEQVNANLDKVDETTAITEKEQDQ